RFVRPHTGTLELPSAVFVPTNSPAAWILSHGFPPKIGALERCGSGRRGGWRALLRGRRYRFVFFFAMPSNKMAAALWAISSGERPPGLYHSIDQLIIPRTKRRTTERLRSSR